MASWIENTAWWHIYPLGFLGAEKESLDKEGPSFSRLDKLEPWLKYMKELGCNGLLLAPIFASQTHGYDTIDHYSIDSRLGTDGDFERLIENAKTLGIKVVLDGVFNHVGRQFAPFEDVRTLKQDSKYANWFHIDWDKTNNEDSFSYRNFEGHHQLVTLNHDNPEVADYVIEVMTYWLGKGIDGWRLDAAYAVPAHFWHKTISKIKEEFPHCWFLGEVIHGDYAQIAKHTGFDSITQYELWKAIWSALNDRNFFELAHALARHNQFAEAFLPNTFIGNHDVTRIASQLKNFKHLDLAIAILGTVPGVPSIYAGDEQAYTGIKEHRSGGDDDIRTEFPENPSGFLEEGWTTHKKYQKMLAFRRENPWLARARVNSLLLQNTIFIYEVVADNEQAIVALNCSDTDATISDHAILSKLSHCKTPPALGNITSNWQIKANNTVVWLR
ncbi:MAG: alpha-amylase family glycosyl hydrolase [Candidatus Obscuribacterales bacterium]|nr:alpha-amylase family glycosyl hydrolase [Candidatus Obscuribacterales bacterium]